MGDRTATDGGFQPQPAPSTYAYPPAQSSFEDQGMLQDHHSFQASAQAVAPTVSSMHGMELPFVPPLPPRSGRLELMDGAHPFVYRGVDWNSSMREMTDPDGTSVDSQGRRSSSRGSSEVMGGSVKTGKKGSKEKKKTGMACHFCRCKSPFTLFF